MLIIIEGPDCTGKSTLVKRIHARLVAQEPGSSITVVHRGPPTKGNHPLDEYESPLFTYRPERNKHVICDRWHVGEVVYPSIFKRPTQMDTTSLLHIELFLESRGAVVCTLMPPRDEHVIKFHQRGDELVRADQLDAIRTSFMKHYTTSRLVPILIRDPFNLTDDMIDKMIINPARDASLCAQSLNKITTYVGPPDPKVLLLGDVRHAMRKLSRQARRALGGTSADATLPAAGVSFGPYPGTSGQYLLSALPNSLDFIGLANACDVDDLDTIICTLNFPRVVALGHNAWKELLNWRLRSPRAQHIVAGAVPHPQFMRRFHFYKPQQYGTLLMQTAHYGGNHISWRPV